MKKRTILPAFLAILMVLCVSVGSALAYFTTWTKIDMEKDMKLNLSSSITETEADKDHKVVKIENTGNEAEFVRVIVFANDSVSDLAIEGTSVQSGTYWEYPDIIQPDEEVELTITFVLPTPAAEGDRVNVAVLYECTPALYNASTDSYYANWTLPVVPQS